MCCKAIPKRPFSEPTLTVISLNVEGLTSVKQDIIADICKKNACDVLCIQETHRGSDSNRPKIAGMKLIIEHPHGHHGSAVFVRENLSCKADILKLSEDIEILTIELANIAVTSIYKPPTTNFAFDPDAFGSCPNRVIIGDFNSHSTLWGYSETNADGHLVENWAENNSLQLIHDAKLPPSFNSGRWQRGYNPDLIFVSSHMRENCTKGVLQPIPKSQHRPIILKIGAAVKPRETVFKRRFNFQKANWTLFARDLDSVVRTIEPKLENYDIFVEQVKRISRNYIPRGCRVNYIPGLRKEDNKLYEAYIESYNRDPFSEGTAAIGDVLTTCLAEKRRGEWRSLIEGIDMKHSSRQAWRTMRKLNNDPKQPVQRSNVTANAVAHQLVLNGKFKANKQLKLVRDRASETSTYSKQFTLSELDVAIAALKQGKAAGLDDIRNEQIAHFGSETKKWILCMFNRCLDENAMPKIWRKSKIIALPKPGKALDDPKNFRPISLLCCLYKLFERMILNRLVPNVDEQLIPEQAGFRPGKTCTAQILNLTQYIEEGYEQRKITGAVFVDLSSAYDTVNHRLLLAKLYSITHDYGLVTVIRSLLENRRFYVTLGDKNSRWRIQANGLPQGSVLAPTLFNIYTNDQPSAPGIRRFLYADDLAIAAQSKSFHEIEEVLETCLRNLSVYYRDNCLRPNPTKTISSLFHLKNREANREVQINWEGQNVRFSKLPVYLGVTLDRTLSFKTHIDKTKAKVSARNNLLQKLTCSKWGADPNTLRSTALTLCYSAAEYAAPVWERSAHAHKLDPVLNNTCRLVTGCLKPTPTGHLYLLSGIAPPSVRRAVASQVERKKQETDVRHPLYGHQPPPSRLKSRRSFLTSVTPLVETSSLARISKWTTALSDRERELQITPNEQLPPGADQPWTTWKSLNRLRTRTGRCKTNMKKWGLYSGSDECSCGQPQTMLHILNCPTLQQPCLPNDLAAANPTALACANYWCHDI